MKPAPEKPPRRKGKPLPALKPSAPALALWLLRDLRGDVLLLRARIDDILAALNTKWDE